MSYFEKIFPVNRSEFSTWGFFLLLLLIVLSSISDNGIFSSTDQNKLSVIIPIIITSYLIIIGSMRMLGLKPNKFEMIFIPLIILSMIYITLSFTDTMPTIEDENDEEAGSDNLSELDRSQLSNLTGAGEITNGPNAYLQPADNKFNNLMSSIFRIGLFILAIIIVIFVLLYFAKRSEQFIPGISIANEVEYNQPMGQYQMDIVQTYIEASNYIEGQKGRAPKWFSPTKFSDEVMFKPGPPLSSYFSRLTILYEWARFSDKELSIEDALEAKDLFLQIRSSVEQWNMNITMLENQ